MANETRELFDLTVDEISLVNFPANEEEFIIVKQLNQEDIKMPKTEEATVEKTTEETVEVQPEVEKEEATETVAEETTEVVAEKAEEEVVEEEVVEQSADDALVEKVATATAEAVAKSMGEFVQTLKSALMPEQEVAEITEPEAVAEETVEAAPEVAPVTETDVNKALLGRLDALVDALTTTKVEKSAEVEENTEESPVLKALATLEEKLEKQLTGMDSRLAAVEDTRMPSQSLDAETDTTVQKSVEENIWDGVFR